MRPASCRACACLPSAVAFSALDASRLVLASFSMQPRTYGSKQESQMA